MAEGPPIKRTTMIRIRYKNPQLKLVWRKYASQYDDYETALTELMKKEGLWSSGLIY